MQFDHTLRKLDCYEKIAAQPGTSTSGILLCCAATKRCMLEVNGPIISRRARNNNGSEQFSNSFFIRSMHSKLAAFPPLSIIQIVWLFILKFMPLKLAQTFASLSQSSAWTRKNCLNYFSPFLFPGKETHQHWFR